MRWLTDMAIRWPDQWPIRVRCSKWPSRMLKVLEDGGQIQILSQTQLETHLRSVNHEAGQDLAA